MNPPSRRDLLVGAIYAALLAVFPWLRRKKAPERYLYQLASFDVEDGERIHGVEQVFTTSGEPDPGEPGTYMIVHDVRFHVVHEPINNWRFSNGDMSWKILKREQVS